MENNKVACEEPRLPVVDIDLGIVKIERNVIPAELESVCEPTEIQWQEKKQPNQHQRKTFNRGQRMVNWREAEVNYLIDMIKSHSYVWDTTLPDFKKKHLKSHFWELAAEKINSALRPRTPLTRNDCFKKWNNLRTYFQGELKGVKTKNSSGISDAEDIGGGWKYGSKLSFLLGSRNPQISVNTFNNSDQSAFDPTACLSDSNGESEMGSVERSMLLEHLAQEPHDNEYSSQLNASYDNVLETMPGTQQTKRKRKHTESPENTLPHTMENNANTFSGVMTNQMNMEQESPSYFYSKYVAQCLDKLDPDLNLEAREQICEILFKCEKAQLKRH